MDNKKIANELCDFISSPVMGIGLTPHDRNVIINKLNEIINSDLGLLQSLVLTCKQTPTIPASYILTILYREFPQLRK